MTSYVESIDVSGRQKTTVRYVRAKVSSTIGRPKTSVDTRPEKYTRENPVRKTRVDQSPGNGSVSIDNVRARFRTSKRRSSSSTVLTVVRRSGVSILLKRYANANVPKRKGKRTTVGNRKRRRSIISQRS